MKIKVHMDFYETIAGEEEKRKLILLEYWEYLDDPELGS